MATQDDYQVRLSSFQGPLDLLLYLIRRAEVSIEDIPIHEITQQYLEFLKQLGQDSRIDIDLAGEFLVMAATLVEIKSRTLAPKPDGDEAQPAADAGEAADPRQELVAQLLAYQRYRSAADALDRAREEHARRFVARAAHAACPRDDEGEGADVDIEDAHILDLFETFERIIGAIDLSRLGDHTIEYDDTPIALHQADLLDRLQRAAGQALPLRAVFEGRSRGEMIGLFLATLELARQRKLLIRQDNDDAEIEVTLHVDEEPTANQASTAATGEGRSRRTQ